MGRPGHPRLLTLYGSPEYGDFLDALQSRVGATDRSDLAERAFAALARRRGVDPPRRASPVGTNRYTTPRKVVMR